ncbi:uncharacterized protein LOC117335659 [Pecten maximus]|uniref:uncharacterized protein LOC117335659 n=1 Tax=Pecten maximus TaxID=6579 RepID=UPI001458B579|nr:uncharacterized protein LOC117335659 [Pecten maximus]
MISLRKLPFWEKFSFGRPGLNALFQPNSSTHNPSYDYESDKDFNVVITPAPDYDDTSSKISKRFKQFWTMKGRSKNANKRTSYSYECDDNEKSQTRRRDHQRTPKRHHRHSQQQDEDQSDDSDWSLSSTSTHNTMDYRKVEKRHRRRHKSSSGEKQERKSGSRSSRKHERDFESPSCDRRHRRDIPLPRKQEKTSNRRKRKVKCSSDMDYKRGRHSTDWDSCASDSSHERMQAKLTRNRKQVKPKKGKKMAVSDTDDNWTIRQKRGNQSDGVMLKISMNDLRNVITENVLSAVKQGMDDDRTNQTVRHVSPEVLTTDTETLHSGFSAGSCNSTEALLPIISGRRMSSAFHPVPQRQSGMLKRFIPVQSPATSDNTGQSRNSSVTTIKSYLSSSTTDPVDMAVGSKTTAHGGAFGTATAHYDRLEDKLMMQTNALRGRHVREPTVMMYDDDVTQETIPHNPIPTQSKHSYFQDGQPYEDSLSPRLSVDLPCEPVKGSCLLQDSNGRRMSGVTLNTSQRGSFSSSESDIRQRRGSLHPDFDSALPTNCNDHRNSRRQSLCGDIGPLHITDNAVPNPAYLSRRRQSLPVNLTSYPYTDLASIGMNALIAATDSKVQAALKEKPQTEKCLSTVQEESTDSIEERPSKADPPQKVITKPSAELLKNIKETEKEKRKVKVSKILALLSSILVLLAGVGVLGLGILNMMDGEAQMYVAVTKKNPKDNNFQYYCYGLCFIGASVVLVCVCSCVGALKVKTCLLKMVILGLVLMLTLQVVMVAMVVVSQKDMPSVPLMAAVMDGVKDVVTDHLKTSLRINYKTDTLLARAWDQLQVQMECCGCQNQDDYKYSAWWNATSDSKTKMPDSCCIVAVKDLDDLKPTNKFLCQSMTPGFWHETGCHDILMVWYKQNSVMAFGATTGLAALEIVGLFCTVRLYRILSRKTTTNSSGSV